MPWSAPKPRMLAGRAPCASYLAPEVETSNHSPPPSAARRTASGSARHHHIPGAQMRRCTVSALLFYERGVRGSTTNGYLPPTSFCDACSHRRTALLPSHVRKNANVVPGTFPVHHEPQMTKLVHSIAEACSISDTGRTALYQAIRLGKLRAVKRGKRTLILTEDLRRWVETFPAVTVKSGTEGGTSD
jgi:excisionase family DNA binding protein